MIEWLLTHPLSTRVPNFWPAVLLALGFPLVELVLTEAIAACERRGVRFARTLRNLRDLVVPSLAVLLLVSLVLGLPADGGVVRDTAATLAAIEDVVGRYVAARTPALN